MSHASVSSRRELSRSHSTSSLSGRAAADEARALLAEAGDEGLRQRRGVGSRVMDVFRSAVRRVVPPPHKKHFKQQAQYESLDYEFQESLVEQAEWSLRTQRAAIMHDILRWIVLFIVGVLTATIAFSIDMMILYTANLKFSVIKQSIDTCIKEDCLAVSFILWLGIDVGFVLFATLLVNYGEPIAAGSGIPEVKCYLNGIKMPHVVRLKTLAVKAVGVVAAVAGGLTVGKEGPMIHSGAVVAAGISQGKSTSLPFINTPLFRQFRSDTEKRDFVSGGAAAGVSAAFGAPIGGVLFALEEGSSFWNQSLTWRIFFGSMTATFVLNILLSGTREGVWGALSNPGLINFGKFQDMPYSLYELPLFMLIGLIGGLLGAAFNGFNHALTLFRMRYITTRPLRVLEAVVISCVTCSIGFALMFFSEDCLPLDDLPESDNPLQFFCAERQYNAMASLIFNTPEESIKNLFHNASDNFQVGTLGMFFLAYFSLSCVTYGLAVPSGLFVPCILTGASWGRLMGNILMLYFPGRTWVEPGKYALIGAAATLGGVVRMTISLTVIIIEATGNVTYGLPIMLAVVFAKWSGDFFNEGLYDIHIHIKHIPILGWEPPPVVSTTLTASDFMTRRIHCVRPVNRVSDIYRMLRNSRHNAFPVIGHSVEDIDNDGGGANVNSSARNRTVSTSSISERDTTAVFSGVILRHQLVLLLKHRVYGRLDADGDRVFADTLSMEQIRAAYPRWPSLDSVNVPPEDMDLWLDVRPCMNSSPYLVFPGSSLARIFRLFRTMGLRHLVIVNLHNQVVGLVTRKDLANLRSHHRKEEFLGSCATEVSYVLPEDFRDPENARLLSEMEANHQ